MYVTAGLLLTCCMHNCCHSACHAHINHGPKITVPVDACIYRNPPCIHTRSKVMYAMTNNRTQRMFSLFTSAIPLTHLCLSGVLSSLLVPHVFGKPIGRSGDTLGTISSLPRPDSQAALPSPTSLGQVRTGRYRSGTSPLVSHTSGRPMHWGFSNMVSSGSVPASDRQKQPFELPTVIKGAAGSMRGPPGLGPGRPQQPSQYVPAANLSGHNSRQLLGRQY